MLVHTPWKPGKAELTRRERLRRRLRGLVYQKFKECNNTISETKATSKIEAIDQNNIPTQFNPSVSSENNEINSKISDSGSSKMASFGINYLPPVKNNETEEDYYERVLKIKLGKVWNIYKSNDNVNWNPTQDEIDQWDKEVFELTQKVEKEANTLFQQTDDRQCDDDNCRKDKMETNLSFIQVGKDRNGFVAKQYKDSLPPFMKAASMGDLSFLKESINKCIQNNNDDDVRSGEEIIMVIETRDRNGSIAEHWAAGGGHLDCLKFIFELRSRYTSSLNDTSDSEKKNRKRDGKTCLHYAARNGHDHIIDYLLKSSPDDIRSIDNVDVQSNDGTTPLHLACYGGHSNTIKTLIMKYKADFHKVNEWGCGVGHWIAMSVQTDVNQLSECLDFIKGCSSTTFDIFGVAQKQGHTAIHKAAQKLNQNVLEFIMKEAKDNWTEKQIHNCGQVDKGGNAPSQIWSAMGGDEKMVSKLHEFGW